MLDHPEELRAAAENAGIEVPDETEEFVISEYPHFALFCYAQLNKPMKFPFDHWTNAKVIAKLSHCGLKEISPQGLFEMGFKS